MKKIFAVFIFSLMLLFTVSVGTTYAAPLTSEFADKKIIWLGDSITSGYGATSDANRFVNIVDEELGFSESVNYGVGGATISQYVVGGENLIDIAATMDLDADIVMVFGGINDFYNSVPLGTSTDTDATLSVYGGLNTLIPLLETNYPTARIILVSPFGGSTATPNGIAGAMQERARHYGIEFINMFLYSGFDLHIAEDQAIYAIDTVHMSDQGNRRLADIFISYLYEDYTVNLYNPLTVNNDVILTTSGGLEAEPIAGFDVSDYMPVIAGTTYYYSAYDYSGTSRAVAWYDSDQVFISDSNNVDSFVTAPEGAAYARLQTYFTDPEEAQFSKIVNYDYKVTFDTRGGEEMDPQYVTEYRDIVGPETPIKEGSTFYGWYTNDILTQAFNPFAPVTQDMTLYASWTAGGGSVIVPDEPVVSTENLIYAGIAILVILVGSSLFTKPKKRGYRR